MSLNDSDVWYTYPRRSEQKCYVARERLRWTPVRELRLVTHAVIYRDLEKHIDSGLFRVSVEYTPELVSPDST